MAILCCDIQVVYILYEFNIYVYTFVYTYNTYMYYAYIIIHKQNKHIHVFLEHVLVGLQVATNKVQVKDHNPVLSRVQKVCGVW